MEEGEEREKTRFVSHHFPKDFPGLLLCLDVGVRRMAQVCSLRVGREDAWARMMMGPGRPGYHLEPVPLLILSPVAALKASSSLHPQFVGRPHHLGCKHSLTQHSFVLEEESEVHRSRRTWPRSWR